MKLSSVSSDLCNRRVKHQFEPALTSCMWDRLKILCAMVQTPLRAAAFSSPPGECTRESAAVAPQEHQHAWTGEEHWRQMEKMMTVLPVRIRSVCLFWAGVQEVDQWCC